MVITTEKIDYEEYTQEELTQVQSELITEQEIIKEEIRVLTEKFNSEKNKLLSDFDDNEKQLNEIENCI